MIKRFGQNRALRASKRKKFKGDNRATIYSDIHNHDKATFKEFPKEQVSRAIDQIRQKFKTKRRMELIFSITVIGCIAILMVYTMVSTTDYSKKLPIEQDPFIPPIVWSGKKSDPMRVPFSPFFYAPNIGNTDYEGQLDQQYLLYDNDMVVFNTTNIHFFDGACNPIGKLLPKNGYISWMQVWSGKEGSDTGKMYYLLAEKDTDYDGIVTSNDRHFLYTSTLNGKELTRTTEEEIDYVQWRNEENKILLKFKRSQESKDSLYGIYNTETMEMIMTNSSIKWK